MFYIVVWFCGFVWRGFLVWFRIFLCVCFFCLFHFLLFGCFLCVFTCLFWWWVFYFFECLYFVTLLLKENKTVFCIVVLLWNTELDFTTLCRCTTDNAVTHLWCLLPYCLLPFSLPFDDERCKLKRQTYKDYISPSSVSWNSVIATKSGWCNPALQPGHQMLDKFSNITFAGK